VVQGLPVQILIPSLDVSAICILPLQDQNFAQGIQEHPITSILQIRHFDDEKEGQNEPLQFQRTE